MDPLKHRVLAVLTGAAVVVGGANLTAYAANGHALLLGRANSEATTASLTKLGKGPALSLHTSKKSAPFAVNSAKVVHHLNAASVGGHGVADLQTHATTWSIPGGAATSFSLPGAKPGAYLATVHVLMDAAGTTQCELTTNLTDVAVFGVSRGTLAMVSGGGFLDVDPVERLLNLTCTGATAIDDTLGPGTVTLLRVDRSSRVKAAAAVAPRR